jgi:hypothetical protein
MAIQVCSSRPPLGDALGPGGPGRVHRLERRAAGHASPAALSASRGCFVLLGDGLSNVVAIVANRGATAGVSPDAAAAIGRTAGSGTQTAAWSRVVLGCSTDLFAMPTWIPMANVFGGIERAHRGQGSREDRRRDARPRADGGVQAPHRVTPVRPGTDRYTRRGPVPLRRMARLPDLDAVWGLSDVRFVMTDVQGKPVVRWGRKARDLPSGRPPGCRRPSPVRSPSR